MHLRKEHGRIHVTLALVTTGVIAGLFFALTAGAHGSGPGRVHGSGRAAVSFPDGYRAAHNSVLSGQLRALYGPGYRPVYLVAARNAARGP